MIKLRSDRLTLIILPKRGGKIASFRELSTDREFLSQHDDIAKETGEIGKQRPSGERLESALEELNESPGPDAGFCREHDWGWDDIAPAITAETYALSPGFSVKVPDHGETWRYPWRILVAPNNTTVTLQVTGKLFPFVLTRRTELFSRSVKHEYTIENFGDTAIPWMWVAHPLFTLNPGMYIEAPAEWKWMRNALTTSELPRYNGIYTYPGNNPNLMRCPTPNTGVARKLFFEHSTNNTAKTVGVVDSFLNRRILFHVNPAGAGWFGIWCNAGFLFGHNNIAVEPASAPMDSLSSAARLGRLPMVRAGETRSWWFAVEIAKL